MSHIARRANLVVTSALVTALSATTAFANCCNLSLPGSDPSSGTVNTNCASSGAQHVEDLVAVQVHFNTDECRINRDHVATIRAAVEAARARNPGQPIYAYTVGETDPRATDAYNEVLGQRRANGLKAELERLGVIVIDADTLGESRTPQHIRNNPQSRNAWGLVGDEATIRACHASQACTADVTYKSSLRLSDARDFINMDFVEVASADSVTVDYPIPFPEEVDFSSVEFRAPEVPNFRIG